MKKFTKSFILATIIPFCFNSAYIQPVFADSECELPVSGQKVSYKTLSDYIASLDHYAAAISRNPSSVRWKEVPENLLMVYLWNKENYNDNSFVELADKWVQLSNVKNNKYVPYAKLTNIFANLIKQNFNDAENTYRFNQINKENAFLSDVAKTLIGVNEKSTASLPGNQSLTFTYNARLISLEDTRSLVSKYPESGIARYISSITLERIIMQEENKEEKTVTQNDLKNEITRASELEPQNILFAINKFEAIYDESIEGRGEDNFKDLLEESDNNTYVAEEIGNFFARNRQVDKSIDYMTMAVKSDKTRFGLYKKLNSLYSYKEDFKPVIELYESAIEDNQYKAELYGELADLYIKNNETNEKIIELYQKAIKNFPQNSDFYVSLGDAYYNSKLPDKALKEYLNAINLDKKNADAYGKIISFYWDKNDSENTLKFANEAVNNNPDYVMSYLWAGSVYLKQNKIEDAIKSIQKSIEVNPKFIPGYNSLGIAYRATKQYDKAIEQFKKSLELNPNYIESLINIGDTYFQKGDYKESEKAYNQALEAEPYNDNIYFLLGNLFTESKEYQKAEKAYEKSILISPKSLDGRNNLGNVYLKQAKLDQALNEFQKILEIEPKYATAYYNIACVFSLKKSKDESFKFLQKAILLDKSLKDVAKNDPDFDNVKNEKKFKQIIE